MPAHRWSSHSTVPYEFGVRWQCGETPLHKAAMAGKDLNVKRLLEMTADINAVDNVTIYHLKMNLFNI